MAREHERGEGSQRQAFQARVTIAVKERNIERLMATIAEIDRALTGYESHYVSLPEREEEREERVVLRRGIEEMFADIDRDGFGSFIAPLSDSGLSRLVIKVDEGEVIMGPDEYTSTKEVKNAWAAF